MKTKCSPTQSNFCICSHHCAACPVPGCPLAVPGSPFCDTGPGTGTGTLLEPRKTRKYIFGSTENQEIYIWKHGKPLLYFEIIFSCQTFNFMFFVGRAINKFKIPTKYIFTLVIAYILKSTNSSIHKHNYRLQAMKFRVHEIK